MMESINQSIHHLSLLRDNTDRTTSWWIGSDRIQYGCGVENTNRLPCLWVEALTEECNATSSAGRPDDITHWGRQDRYFLRETCARHRELPQLNATQRNDSSGTEAPTQQASTGSTSPHQQSAAATTTTTTT